MSSGIKTPVLPGEVLVWQLSLNSITWLQPLLSIEEAQRAARFARAQDCYRYTLGRSLLRYVLGQCLGRAPLSLCFSYGPHGKPRLEDSNLCFNLAHSAGTILIAVSKQRQLGIDIEHVRTDKNYDDIIENVVAGGDRADWSHHSPARRRRAFLRYWVRYEALVKARGQSLSTPLPEIATIERGFQVRFIRAGAGYLAAVAADNLPWRIVRCRLCKPAGYEL